MNLNRELREESRGGTSGRRAQRARRVLAMAQVAIALVLLMGAGLLLASFRAVTHLDFGFNPENVMTATVNLPGSYAAPARGTFIDTALEKLHGIPGVVAVGGAVALPFSGNISPNVILAEGHVMKPGESLLAPAQAMATTGYFEAMRIPIIKGRVFDARDTSTSPHVPVIDQKLAERFWPGLDAVGRRLYRPDDIKNITKTSEKTDFYLVVGVVKDVVVSDPKADLAPVGTYYLAASQFQPGGLNYTVRLAKPSATIGNDIKQAIASIDKQLPIFRLRPMQEWIDRALVGRRAPMLIAAGFSAVALFLAAIGIYGVLAYGVSERKRELGVRMALGGSTGSIFRLVLNDGLLIVGAGVVAGLLGSYFVGRLMQSLLFGVAPMNVAVIGLVTLVLSAVALLASGIPALKASRIDPVVVLSR
jgi:predicted permease